jgi:phosphate uptake regulator
MTKAELDHYAKDLHLVQQKFAGSIIELVEYCAAIGEQISGFTSYLESWRTLAQSTGELMTSRLEMSTELVEMQKQVLKAYADSNLSIAENSERLDKLMIKMEKHFGSDAESDYEN